MRRELKIGIFMASALLILALFIFIVGDLTVLFKKPGYPLFVTFDSVAGLEKRAVVRMAGVKVGYVKDIQLVGRKSEVLLNIYPKFKVLKSSKATLAALGLLGEKYIEILPGEEETFCQPGEAIKGLPSLSLDQLGTLFLSIGDEVKELGKTLRDVMGEESRTNLKAVLENLASFSEEMKEFLGENRGPLRQSIRSSAEAFQNFDQRTREVTENLDKTISLLKNIAEENRESVKVDLERIKELILKVEESLKLLSESLEKINKGEGSLGKLIHEPDLYEKADGVLDEVRKTADSLSSLRMNIDFRADYYGKSELLKNSLGLILQLRARNFFLAQIVHDPWQEKFTYSVQGGKRLGSLAPRAGIIESQFGAGLDYIVLSNRLRFSLESFHFNRQPRPHFRFLTKYFPQESFYFIFGIDDFTLASKREVFFGLGLGLQ